MAVEREINEKQLEFILGEDRQSFYDKITPSCFCSCEPEGTRSIVDYRIYLNDLNDLVLRGRCGSCGCLMNRYVETGENEEYLKKIEKLRSKRLNTTTLT